MVVWLLIKSNCLCTTRLCVPTVPISSLTIWLSSSRMASSPSLISDWSLGATLGSTTPMALSFARFPTFAFLSLSLSDLFIYFIKFIILVYELCKWVLAPKKKKRRNHKEPAKSVVCTTSRL